MQINLKTIFKVLVTLLVLSFIFLLTSCDIQKNATKSKSDTSLKDDLETKRFRSGDSVSYRPRQGRIIFKDTTIYRYSKQNTVLQTIYDKDGNIRDINCYAAQIEELTRRNFQLEQATKEKDKAKTENFDSTFIFYIMGGVVLIVFFALFLMYLYMKKNTGVLTAAIAKITS
jgi:uncharacterized membrane protein